MIPALHFPPAYQRAHYAHVLKVPCPICFARVGEPCRPASLSLPHLARVELAEEREQRDELDSPNDWPAP